MAGAFNGRDESLTRNPMQVPWRSHRKIGMLTVASGVR
jgi:hypothetical protein